MKVPYAKHMLPDFVADEIYGRGEFEGKGLERRFRLNYVNVVRDNPRGAGGMGEMALMEAVQCSWVKDIPLMRRCLSIAMDGIMAASRAYVAGLGVEVDFVFDGKLYRGAADFVDSEADCIGFMRFFSMAIALRRTDAQLALSAMTTEIERTQGGGDDGFLILSEAYRHFWRNEADTRGLLEDAAAHLEPSQLQIADPRWAACYTTCIPAMVALLDGDEVAFNQALFEGVKAHKAWWGRGERRWDPDGFWAAFPLALAVMAYERGMPVRVESDYIPRWFIEGKDPS